MIQNFHFQSLRDAITPRVMHRSNNPSSISFRLKTTDVSGTIASLQALWEKHAPGLPFRYEFMDEQFDRLYHSER
ncbi:MAG: hypothetical protein ACKVU2_09850 [Saprospiraceae bacterium]